MFTFWLVKKKARNINSRLDKKVVRSCMCDMWESFSTISIKLHAEILQIFRIYATDLSNSFGSLGNVIRFQNVFFRGPIFFFRFRYLVAATVLQNMKLHYDWKNVVARSSRKLARVC